MAAIRSPMGLASGRRAAALLLGASLALAAGLTPARADKVGVAAAVEPDAFSSLSGTPNKQLNIGKSIFYNERINTTASGLVQVLLVDGSTFTVGPNSDLVIDKFVYDPRKKTGEMVATFSKGTMRFIGGKLSKNAGGVKVNTPAGALAIRGGMFQGSTSRGIYSFLYGHSLTLTGRNGHSETIFEPGYTFATHGSHANIRPTTPEDTNIFMQALSRSGTNFGSGGNVGTPTNPNAFQEASNLSNGASQQTNDANFIQVQTAIQEQLVRLANLQNSQTNNTPPTNPPAGSTTTEPTPEPVIKNGGTFTGFASGFLQTGTNGHGKPEFLIDGASNVTLDPDANTVTAKIDVTHVDGLILPKTTTFHLGFSGTGDEAYVDDNTFLALADDGTSSVVRSKWVKKVRGGIRTLKSRSPHTLVLTSIIQAPHRMVVSPVFPTHPFARSAAF